ncbi:hypothetical protein Daus18300_000312 [Diaporthe australafricana]|uniref:Uncharacterized protein n=1 Tax=Diaporthe australafricana TaxID=127596 RepID=A0ABR3Y4Q9_9PEZI
MRVKCSLVSMLIKPHDIPVKDISDDPLLLALLAAPSRYGRFPDPNPVQAWSPPKDPDKLYLPYLPGLDLQIHRHVPPASLVDSQEKNALQPRPLLTEEDLKSVRQSQAVFANPPLETDPPASSETAQLMITASIAIGARRGAQVVGCTIYPQADGEASVPFQAAAKIYDPLYYKFSNDSHPEDNTYEADKEYSTEAGAYEHLSRAGQTGGFAPEYYGSWTFRLPITIDGKAQTRPVRLILMERLHGTTIINTRINHPETGLNAFHYPEEYRLEVLARAMEGDVRLMQTGIANKFGAFNIMLVSKESDPSAQELETVGGLVLPRIVLLDYSNAKMTTNTPPEQVFTRPSLPENPLSIFFNFGLFIRFWGWTPSEWNRTSEDAWLLERFNGEEERQRYLPIDDDTARELSLDGHAAVEEGHGGPEASLASSNIIVPQRPGT